MLRPSPAYHGPCHPFSAWTDSTLLDGPEDGEMGSQPPLFFAAPVDAHAPNHNHIIASSNFVLIPNSCICTCRPEAASNGRWPGLQVRCIAFACTCTEQGEQIAAGTSRQLPAALSLASGGTTSLRTMSYLVPTACSPKWCYPANRDRRPSRCPTVNATTIPRASSAGPSRAEHDNGSFQ